MNEMYSVPEDLLNICGIISEDQPISSFKLRQVIFPNTTQPCKLRISQKNFRLTLRKVSTPTRLMVQLMEQISQTSNVELVSILETSLVGLKSFNLTNKAESLLAIGMTNVGMDKDLCASMLNQIPLLTNLKFLKIRSFSTGQTIKGNMHFCHILRDMCPDFLRLLSRLDKLLNLNLTGNNLTGCLPNFLPDTNSTLPLIKELVLKNTALTSDDVNHIIHIIESGKLPKLEYLNLDENDFHGMWV